MKAPFIMNLGNLKKDFSFLVKENVGVYDVYDYEERVGFFAKRELPTKEFENKADLDLFAELLDMLGFYYKRIEDNKIQFVDPEHEEYEKVDLPLYTKTNRFGTQFSYLNTSYVVENVPTKETVEKAIVYLTKVLKKIKEVNIKTEVEMNIDFSMDGVSTILDTRYDVSEILEKEKYLVFHIYKPFKSNVKYKSLIISKEMAKTQEYNGVLSILVPKEVAGLVIGKGGKNCKAMAEELGVKNISVNVL